MDYNAQALARNMFRLIVHEADGQAYEDLFVRIMQYVSPNFRPIRASGRRGDKKNDGFDSQSGTYFQVYAPEDIRKTDSDAIKKLKRDFSGLKAFWDGVYPVQRFFFVVNDKYRGVSPDLEKELVVIRDKYSLLEAAPLLVKDIEARLFGLTDDQIVSIIGHVPPVEPTAFRFLSGFTYFIAAWINFEKTSRDAISDNLGDRRPLVGLHLINALLSKSWVSSEEHAFLRQISRERNILVHGDSTEVPKKAHIDRLVSVTDAIRAHAKQRGSSAAQPLPPRGEANA